MTYFGISFSASLCVSFRYFFSCVTVCLTVRICVSLHVSVSMCMFSTVSRSTPWGLRIAQDRPVQHPDEIVHSTINIFRVPAHRVGAKQQCPRALESNCICSVLPRHARRTRQQAYGSTASDICIQMSGKIARGQKHLGFFRPEHRRMRNIGTIDALG